MNRTSLAHSYVLRARSGRALLIDFGYDFCFGQAGSTEQDARQPWLYTLPALMARWGVRHIDAVIPTHYHDDHVAGIPLLREVYGTQLWVTENIVDVLAQPGAYRLPCLWFEGMCADRSLTLKQPFDWEEFRITPHELAGHTRYGCALLVEAYGERVLFGGDQYGDPDGLGLVYTYANLIRETDYVRSAELYAALRPNLILSGHSGPLEPREDYFGTLLARGQQLQALHARLQPHSARLIVRAEPIRVSSGQPITLTIENPTDMPFEGELHVSGRAAEPACLRVHVPGQRSIGLPFYPSGPAGAGIHFELRGDRGEPGQFTHATIQAETGGAHVH
jgi:glyoxylase-like metal-dependent hydrolase (beta-lactamase superfamily II)